MATDRVAISTAYGMMFAADETALAKAIRFVFDVGTVQFTSARLFDSRVMA